MGRQYYDSLEQRVAELEKLIAGHPRPPSRLAQTFKFLIANVDTIETIVEDWKKSREQHIDSKTYNELRAEAERRNLKVEKVLRGYIALCFKQCLADEEVKEAA